MEIDLTKCPYYKGENECRIYGGDNCYKSMIEE